MSIQRPALVSHCAAALLILTLLLASVAPAVAAQPPAPPAANDLLRQAVANEKAAARDAYYAWTDRLQKPRGTVTKIMVVTPQGILSRAVAINDRPLTADERRLDDERINRLLDPTKMNDKAAKQRADQQRIERLLNSMPDGFDCEYAMPQSDERSWRMECSPRAGFSPPNVESQVLLGMKATILIDRRDTRIARIDGTTFRDVNVGWGFLGRFNRGGRIEIVQSKVLGNHWAIQKMALNFDGRVLLVKALHIEETETCWDFHSVPAMGVAQALDYLRAARADIKPH